MGARMIGRIRWGWRVVPVVALLLAVPPLLRPDALVITMAMNATTIAEIFIEEDSVLVQLEG